LLTSDRVSPGIRKRSTSAMKARNHSEVSSDRSAVKAEFSSSRPPAQIATRARRFRLDDALPPLILTPAMIASIVFVYAFIAITVWVSLSKWGTLRMDLNLREPFAFTYQQMFSMPRWHASLRNMFIFTTLFLIGSLFFWLVSSLAPGSKAYWPCHPAKRFFVPLRTLFHCYRHCLAMDFQP